MNTGTIIALVLAGMLLVCFEVFIPGGVVGAIGGLLILAGIIAGFIYDPAWGSALLIGSLIFGVVGFYLWIHFFPKTPMGKRLILSDDAHDWHGFDDLKRELLGKEGIAHSTLRPAGTAIIDNKRVDVVTQGGMIDAKSRIKVVKVEGNRIVVAKATGTDSNK